MQFSRVQFSWVQSSRNPNMHACIHTYMYVYVHPCRHACIHKFMKTYIQTDRHAYITYMHVSERTFMHTYIHACIQTDMHTYVGTFIHTYRQTWMHACMYAYIHNIHNNGWPLDFVDTRLRGKLAIPVCRHLLRHSCIVFTQYPQSQLVVYTVIIAEQTVSES